MKQSVLDRITKITKPDFCNRTQYSDIVNLFYRVNVKEYQRQLHQKYYQDNTINVTEYLTFREPDSFEKFLNRI